MKEIIILNEKVNGTVSPEMIIKELKKLKIDAIQNIYNHSNNRWTNGEIDGKLIFRFGHTQKEYEFATDINTQYQISNLVPQFYKQPITDGAEVYRFHILNGKVICSYNRKTPTIFEKFSGTTKQIKLLKPILTIDLNHFVVDIECVNKEWKIVGLYLHPTLNREIAEIYAKELSKLI